MVPPPASVASSPRAFPAADPVALEVDGHGVGASVRGSHRLQGPANSNDRQNKEQKEAEGRRRRERAAWLGDAADAALHVSANVNIGTNMREPQPALG